MSPCRRLFFLRDVRALDGLALSAGDCCVGLNWDVQRRLASGSPRCLTVRELVLPRADIFGRQAWAMSSRWYKNQDQDLTLFRGVSVGQVLEGMAWISAVLPAARHFTLADRALEELRPQSVHCDASAPAALKKSLHFLAARGSPALPVEWLERPAAGAEDPLGEMLGPTFSWKPRRTAILRDVVLRNVFSILAVCFRAFSPARDGRVRLLAEYYPTLHPLFSALASRPWRRRFDVRMAHWPPKDLALRYLANGWPVLGRLSRRPAPEERSAGGEIIARWRSWKESPAGKDFFSLDGKPFWPVLSEALDRYLADSLAEGLRAVSRAGRVLSDRPYDAVLLPADSMPEQRALVEAARLKGIKSAMVLHGLGSPQPYLTEGFHADYLAADGPAIKDRFAAAGRPAASVITAGGLFDGSPRRRPPPYGLRDRVLLLTNPAVLFSPRNLPGDSEQYLLEALSAVKGLPVRVTVKLHPSESLDYYRRFLEEAGLPGVPLVKDVPFHGLLKTHGVVVGTMSTALVEAMIQNLWVTGVNWMDFPFPPPFNGSHGMPVSRTPEQLRDWLADVLRPSPRPPEHGAVLRDFAGNLDGRQSERFLDSLCGLVSGAGERP